MGNIYTVDHSGTAIIEAASEEEAKEKFLLKEWKVDLLDYYGLKITLQKSEHIPQWRGCIDGLDAMQTEQEA